MEPVELRFVVLGAVRVWRDGTEVDPGPPLRRTLLALLLARGGAPVAVSDLVEGLWADQPPARAVNMIHRHIGELRRLLEPGLPARAEGGLLIRGAGGYRLAVPAGSVDLLRFRELAARARDARRAEQPVRAVAAFAEALALWQGPAAGCPAGAPAHPVFSGLDLEHAAAVREAADTALDCGTADRILPALADSASRHPLDEGLQARLVLALASTGRRAEALDVYRSTAARLADELGVDPGPELSAAHRRVATATDTATRADAGTDTATGAEDTGTDGGTGAESASEADETTAELVRPAQLPAALPVFAGRQPELERLRALIDGDDHDAHGDHDRHDAHDDHPGDPGDRGSRPPQTVAIGVIAGTAGVGKSTLAVHLAHQVADRFPDGQLYVNLRGFDPAAPPVPPQEALRGFLDALGVPPQRIPAGLDAQAALYRSLLADRRVLVLLDNARDSAQVRPLLPASPGCLVVVTSRSRLTALTTSDGARPLTLDVLTPAEARASLVLRLGGARVAAEPEAVDEIVALTARLPLALAVVAARAASHPGFRLAALAAQLREAHGGLDAFRDPEAAIDVQAVFSWSYDTLGPEAARLFRLLALHPGPDVTVHAAAALAGLPVARTRALLAELTGAHLLTEHAPGRHTCHDLLRAYATELVVADESDDERAAGVRRVLDHYLHTAHTAVLLSEPPPSLVTPVAPAEASARPQPLADEAAALDWLTTERAVLLGVIQQAVDGGHDAHVWQLVWTLERFHERFGHLQDYLALQRTALAAAQRLGDAHALAQARHGLGRACLLLHQFDESNAQLRASYGLFEECGDANGQATTLLGLWNALTRQGRLKEALDEAGPALELFRASGHRKGQAYALISMAWGEANLDDCRSALTHAHQALALFQDLGVRMAEGHTWDTLGHVHRRLGEHRRAVLCFERALVLFRETGNPYEEAFVLNRLGDAQHAADDRQDALASWRTALRVLAGLDPVQAAEIRAKIGKLAS
ncbi:tetratricopeptide repeat protein [Streptomyces sp. NBC_01485]|uniref:AfsR/SARP family transcriptional regulator n=1 Tax=Streptomyces sp. NBC_01485 TaxID=2903884 RepID=UPI002E356E78|nr:BTAD domain-containing putative transcriptional regulator [Streptomyces sp. NBC_01485]